MLPKSQFVKLDPIQRLDAAKERTLAIGTHLRSMFMMHEANSFVIYSDMLSSQVPKSYAAHAFNQFQRSMHHFEIVRLCALWDPSGRDRESIPTIIDLFNEPDIISKLVSFTERNDDKRIKECFFQQYVQSCSEMIVRERLSKAIEKAEEINVSLQLKSLRKFRHSYVAHNLILSEQSGDVEKLQYGDERFILEAAVEVVDALHRGLLGEPFDWHGSRKIARRNAQALWGHCKFQLPCG